MYKTIIGVGIAYNMYIVRICTRWVRARATVYVHTIYTDIVAYTRVYYRTVYKGSTIRTCN